MKIEKDITALRTISVEELRSFDGLAEVSTKEAEYIIHTLKELALLTHRNNSNYEQSETISTLRKTK